VEEPDAEVFERYPEAPLDRDNIEYYKGLLRHELRFNRCQDCGHWMDTPRDLCPECWSHDVAPEPVSGRGSVYMLTWLHQGPAELGGNYEEPFPLVSVELAEQRALRLTTWIVNARREDLTVGREMELVWIDRAGAPVPAFQPAGEEARS
jgi:uncharacterized OB-fold protein